MNPRDAALLVFRVELRNILRDRTTLLMMILLPVLLYPFLMVTGAFLAEQSRQALRREPARLALVNAPEELAALLSAPCAETGERFDIVRSTAEAAVLEASLRDRRIHAALVFPAGFDPAASAGATVECALLYDASFDRSLLARTRLAGVLADWRRDLAARALAARDLPATLLEPFTVDPRDIATPRQRGGSILGRAIPLLLILFATLGAFYPAIDVTAMEKEKGTLETLLTAPVPAAALLVGKFLAVLAVTLFSVALNLGSIGLTLAHGVRVAGSLLPKAAPAFAVPLDPWTVGVTLVAMVPLCALVTALMMIVALYARNFKDAQNYMTPLVLLFSLPPLVALLPGYDMSAAAALVPVVNVTLLFKELLVGRGEPLHALLTVASTAVWAALTVTLAARLFGRESVAFRPSEDIGSLFFWRRGAKLSDARRLQITLTAFALMLLCVYYIGPFVALHDPLAGIVVTELLFVLAPALVIALGTEASPRSALRLALPAGRAFATAALLAASAPLFSLLLFTVQNRHLPIPLADPSGSLAALQRALTESPLLFALVAGLLAPVCEELFFRGLLLRHLERSMSADAAIAASAVAFAACHLNPYKFLPTLFAGLWLGLLVRSTGSLLPGILAHAGNNLLALALAGPLAPLLSGDSPGLALWYAVIPAYAMASFAILRLRQERLAALPADAGAAAGGSRGVRPVPS